MTRHPLPSPSRRAFTTGALSFVALVGAGCATGDAKETGTPGESGEPDETGGTGDSVETGDSGEKGDSSETGDSGETGETGETGDSGDSGDSGETIPDEWASGGTAVMSGEYPDPFTDDLGQACVMMCALNQGPCYGETLERKDISEGVSGLPVRLAFRIVDESCAPLAGVVADIWHCAPNGLYSGEDARTECTGFDPVAMASHWFRGTQTTDSSGRVDFDTCWPGWYAGRTIHVHATLFLDGQAFLTVQFFFEDGLITEVTTTHPEYVAYGTPDTSNETDVVSATIDRPAYTFETARMTDGAMLAWKTIVLRSSLKEELCEG